MQKEDGVDKTVVDEQNLIPYQKEELYTPNFIICEPVVETGIVAFNRDFSTNSEHVDHRYSFDEVSTDQQKPRFSILKVAGLIGLIIIGGLSLGVGIGSGYAVLNSMITTNQQVISDMTPPAVLATQVAQAPGNPSPMSMVSAVERVRPAVVSINTISAVSDQQSRFFFSPFFDAPDMERPSSGTGIIFYEDELNVYILTNEHVIEHATSIEIAFGRDRNVSAFVRGRDTSSDLAVLYIPWASLHEVGITHVVTAEFGDSSTTQVGEFVMAIGNALGQGIVTTQGVLSAHNIELEIDNRTLTVLQTDAAINPGNSGGPLINSRGQVIGINTVKISRPAVYGMGFAVTSNVAIPIIDGIMQETARPTLGIRGGNVNGMASQYRELFGVDAGVFISVVLRNSAAERAGLEQGDVITHFDGERVENIEALVTFIGERNLGEQVTLGVMRAGDAMEITITFVQF